MTISSFDVLVLLAKLGDACGTQPNQRACNGLDNAECGEDGTCTCIDNYEQFGEECSCKVDMTESDTVEIDGGVPQDAPGCVDGKRQTMLCSIYVIE